MSTGIFSKTEFDVIYFCPYTLSCFRKFYDSRRYFFIYPFRSKFCLVHRKLLTSCLPCFLECSEVFRIEEFRGVFFRCFIKYFLENDNNFEEEIILAWCGSDDTIIIFIHIFGHETDVRL